MGVSGFLVPIAVWGSENCFWASPGGSVWMGKGEKTWLLDFGLPSCLSWPAEIPLVNPFQGFPTEHDHVTTSLHRATVTCCPSIPLPPPPPIPHPEKLGLTCSGISPLKAISSDVELPWRRQSSGKFWIDAVLLLLSEDLGVKWTCMFRGGDSIAFSTHFLVLTSLLVMGRLTRRKVHSVKS